MRSKPIFHIIEDEPLILETLDYMVSESGYDALCFDSGDKYIEHLNSPEFEAPVAVLSDIAMPGIHGYALVLEIRNRYPFQKVVLITGSPDEAFYQEAASQLCYSLDKPYHAEQLTALLTSLVNCEDAHKSGDKSGYIHDCEFGIDHDCPFHKLK